MGLRAFSPPLRQVQWPLKFRPALPSRYEVAVDPAEFLRVYAEAIWATGADKKFMANWLPVALTGVPRAWLVNLPEPSVAS